MNRCAFKMKGFEERTVGGDITFLNCMLAEIDDSYLNPHTGFSGGGHIDFSHLAVESYLACSRSYTQEANIVEVSSGGYGGGKPIPMKRPADLLPPKGKAVLKDPNREEWLQAGRAEWDGLWRNGTWEWVKRSDVPKNHSVIPTMMIYDCKI